MPNENHDERGRFSSRSGSSLFGSHVGESGGHSSRNDWAFHQKLQVQVIQKIKAAPKPSKTDIARNLLSMKNSSRRGGDFRGNSRDRTARTVALLKEFGDGTHCPCVYCGRQLDSSTLSQDKIYTGKQGGRYKIANLLPACLGCNESRNDKPLKIGSLSLAS